MLPHSWSSWWPSAKHWTLSSPRTSWGYWTTSSHHSSGPSNSISRIRFRTTRWRAKYFSLRSLPDVWCLRMPTSSASDTPSLATLKCPCVMVTLSRFLSSTSRRRWTRVASGSPWRGARRTRWGRSLDPPIATGICDWLFPSMFSWQYNSNKALW